MSNGFEILFASFWFTKRSFGCVFFASSWFSVSCSLASDLHHRIHCRFLATSLRLIYAIVTVELANGRAATPHTTAPVRTVCRAVDCCLGS
jgi:hypothetical protein